MASKTEGHRYPGWMRALALLAAFGFGGGAGVALVVGSMVAASKGWIGWVN